MTDKHTLVWRLRNDNSNQPYTERHEAATRITALEAEKRRTQTDTQRLLWRDDVEGVCPTIEICFEYGETVRCGPCAIKAALRDGVEPNYSLPALPEVSRLKRANVALEAENAELVGALEEAVDLIDDYTGGGRNNLGGLASWLDEWSATARATLTKARQSEGEGK